MNNQSTVRNQRPAKGLKVKQAIQIALILAVCFWLLYQMKQSHGKDYSESSKDKASKERGSDILGRKGSAGWSKGGAVSASEDPKYVGEVSVKKEDGNIEEKIEEESLQSANEANQVEKETEIQKKELNNKDDNSEGEAKGNDESVGLDKNSSREENFQGGHEGTQAIFADQDGAKHVNHDEVGEEKEQIPQDTHDEQENGKGQAKEPKRLEESSTTDKEPKRLEESSTTDKELSTTYKDISRGESKNDSLEGQNSVVDRVVHGFDDVNGVPVDGHDLIESIGTGTGGDHSITGHQEMNSSSNNQSEISENTVNEEVGSKEGTAGADLEAKSKISVQDSNIDIKAKVETSSGTSRIDTIEEATQGGSSVSDS